MGRGQLAGSCLHSRCNYNLISLPSASPEIKQWLGIMRPVRDENRRPLTNEDAITVINEFYDDIETCHGIFREALKMRRPRIINKADETRNSLFDEVKSSCLGHRVGLNK